MTSSTDYIKFRAGDEILCIPVTSIQSISQRAWANVSRSHEAIPSKLDARWELAARQYNANQRGKKWVESFGKVLPERQINRFQLWLRTTLTRYGLI